MPIIQVKTKNHPYEILIQEGSFKDAGELISAKVSPCRVLIISDSNVAPLYAEDLKKSLKAFGFTPSIWHFDAGEQSKTINTLTRIYEACYESGLTRKDCIVALGGGVVGDVAGFAAATYQRGIPYIQIPTTLLAQVDSSVGGKTAIDLPFGKNMAGAFNQPAFVLIDPELLNTLNPKIISDGMAEVIKYGCIRDSALFEILETSAGIIPSAQVIARCVQIKADIVSADEFDFGERMLLNFGHTFGHAIEKASGYSLYTHGEAVSIGMSAAVKVGMAFGVTSPEILPRLTYLLQAWKLPVLTSLSTEAVLTALKADKKQLGDHLNFILLKDLGAAHIHPVPISDLRRAALDSLDQLVLGVPKKSFLPDNLIIHPGKIQGSVRIPASKSLAHRAFICAALTGKTHWELLVSGVYAPFSDDIKATLRCLHQITEAWAEKKKGHFVPELILDCSQSGTTLRLLIPIVAALGLEACFTGQGRLPKRPIHAYQEAFTANGVIMDFPENGDSLPLRIRGRLTAGKFELPGNISSQYISGLLLALPLLESDSTITLTSGLESESYVNMTLSVMSYFGVPVTRNTLNSGYHRYFVHPHSFTETSRPYAVEGDASQAAFWHLASYLGQEITIENPALSQLQGDASMQAVLNQFSSNHAEIDMKDIPDLFPALALAAAASGKDKRIYFKNVNRLRIKESDRIESTLAMLAGFGVENVRVLDNEIIINGVSSLKCGDISSFSDHRIAMTAAIAALKAEGDTIIRDSSCVAKSYPDFFSELKRLGAEIETLTEGGNT
ncbi:3-dehydroquinate synthase [Parasporobacterium paucivorans]|uniref:Multifunctional fusion protein n=1 Tax=Parasporobacterium paucivorans DSM 15970 TaxID=1122934 RepID=A0A1M6DPK4_9FIRM|nr:3-dehydroquinate synthase [Parasporobacterium paucivorans]SHI75194.1 3-dehydroquinate synthase [Parasporobacterium paucivorans DSM 15970]